ncbi:outer membrane lipoprotein chaperone LolA [Kineobactrum sediminis]|uniref:outer membrane lipoprotein chaperone LolA n=1 Tax=Kineobactrum sediminis TaxID=1905677 RepID=UPI0013901CF4|nr:outer membrane lipoprotein chaperone LolA [Kineobactrum sediminis]
MLNTVTALLFSLLLLATPLRAEPVDELLAALDNISQLQGEFRQRQYSQGDVLESESSGRFRLLRPGYFAWEITAPDSQLIIANAEYLWHFDRDLETVTRRPLADSEAMTPLQVLGGNDAALRRNYAVGQDAEGRFVLTPHTTDAGFRRLILELDGRLIRGMEVLDNLNQRVLIDFEALDPDSPLTAADFEFMPPPDADLFYHDE